MQARCYRPSSTTYRYYGGRGIKVCDRWLRSFKNFYEDMGPKPDRSYSIERINRDGNYEPINCKWASQTEQLRNRRSWLWSVDGRDQMGALQRAIEIQKQKANPREGILKGRKGIDWLHVMESIAAGESQISISQRLKIDLSMIGRKFRLFTSKAANAGETKRWQQESVIKEAAKEDTGIGFALSHCYGYTEAENHAHFEWVLSHLTDDERELVLDRMEAGAVALENDPDLDSIRAKLAPILLDRKAIKKSPGLRVPEGI
jgi:hypothetical protein